MSTFPGIRTQLSNVFVVNNGHGEGIAQAAYENVPEIIGFSRPTKRANVNGKTAAFARKTCTP